MSAKEYTAAIERDSGDGSGIAHVEGVVTFTPFCLAGETVRLQVTKIQKRHQEAELLEVLTPSPDRSTPFCPHYGVCGGCSMQHIRYSRALQIKSDRLMDCIARLGGVPKSDYELLPPLGMESPFHYRNKAVFPIQNDKIGYYRAGGREICTTNECALLPQQFLQALHVMRNAISKHDNGVLRSLLLRQNHLGEFIAAINTAGPSLPDAHAYIDALQSVNGLTGIMHGVYTPQQGEAIGKRMRKLYGNTDLPERLAGVDFALSPLSFTQVNRVQAETLYNTARDMAGLRTNETLLDAYCGIGALTQMLARDCAKAVGVEWNVEAVRFAKEAAIANGSPNTQFIQGACEAALPRLYSEGFRPDVAVLDPPRKGCDAAALSAIADMGPSRIVYLSCDAATLSRDIKALTRKGYRLIRARAIDMFPWTRHMECAALLKST